jgi:hypothetical protein
MPREFRDVYREVVSRTDPAQLVASACIRSGAQSFKSSAFSHWTMIGIRRRVDGKQ